jgi:3-keto steroid reductase
VLTGGNGGVGFGIAQRLLAQLSTSQPTDLRDALKLPEVTAESEFCTPNGLTLVIAARNAVKAHKATASLLRAVGKKPPVGSDHSEWRREKTQQIKRYANFQDLSEGQKQSIMSEDEYRFRWLQNLSIEYVGLDLSSVESVMHCCRELDERFVHLHGLGAS